jgi:DNA repair protein SbcD/Mre11
VTSTATSRRLLRRTGVDVPHIGLLHANVGSNPDHAPYAPCSVEDLRRGEMDYWALGHIHRREIVLDGSDGGPWAVYPGNLQGRSPKPSERGAKGASVVHVRNGRSSRWSTSPWTVLGSTRSPSPSGGRRPARGAPGAGGRRTGSCRDAEGRILVLRGVVAGRGSVHADLVRPDAVDDLLLQLTDEAPTDPPVAWTGLSVRTGPPRDPADVAAAEGLLADLAVVVAEARADPAAWADGVREAADAVRRALEVDAAGRPCCRPGRRELERDGS